MKSFFIIRVFVFAMLIGGLVSFSAAAADENTCTFKAVMGKVHLTIWDEDSGQDRQDKIFEGWLKPQERQKIKSSTGLIVFSYQMANEDRSYGDNHRTCKNGKTIHVP